MSLPSGYTRLEYIESTGTQYISTGITPTENTKVVIEFNSSSVSGVVFGQDSGYKVNAFMFAMTVVVFESTKKNISISANAKHTVQVAPKAFKIDNGSSQYIYANKVNAAYPMFLFGNNRNGKFSEGVAMKLYSFKVYENNVLIADYIPCKQGNAVGLYDDVAGAMNLPLGTGEFTSGPSVSGTHKALVNGTVYEVKGGKCMVGGTVYNILKGRTLIDGTGWDIALPSAEPDVSKTWTFNSTVSSPASTLTILYANFTSNGTKFKAFNCDVLAGALNLSYLYLNQDASHTQLNVYYYNWQNEAYRTVTFDEAPSGDLLTWLQANATPQ